MWKATLKSTWRWRARDRYLNRKKSLKTKVCCVFSISFSVLLAFSCSTSFLILFFSQVLQRRFCIRGIPTWPSSCDPRPSRPKGGAPNWWGSVKCWKGPRCRPKRAMLVFACSYVFCCFLWSAMCPLCFSLWRCSLLTGCDFCDFIVLIVIVIVVVLLIVIVIVVIIVVVVVVIIIIIIIIIIPIQPTICITLPSFGRTVCVVGMAHMDGIVRRYTDPNWEEPIGSVKDVEKVFQNKIFKGLAIYCTRNWTRCHDLSSHGFSSRISWWSH